eukprot:1145572-Pelagomonas_calceolata.AAC.1
MEGQANGGDTLEPDILPEVGSNLKDILLTRCASRMGHAWVPIDDRKGKGNIAVSACGGSLAGAKRAGSQTSPI